MTAIVELMFKLAKEKLPMWQSVKTCQCDKQTELVELKEFSVPCISSQFLFYEECDN